MGTMVMAGGGGQMQQQIVGIPQQGPVQGGMGGMQMQQQGGVMQQQGGGSQNGMVMNVNGQLRRLQPVCAQALPWSTSFIGCPGIKCDRASDFTSLFREDGTRDCGNRRTTPLEVENPKDPTTFHARSLSCPWAKPLLQETLERACDPMALHALLDECAPKKPLKVKRVDGQCESCYAAHVALAARLRAKQQGGKGGGKGGKGGTQGAQGIAEADGNNAVPPQLAAEGVNPTDVSLTAEGVLPPTNAPGMIGGINQLGDLGTAAGI